MSNCNPSMTKAGLLKRLNEVSFAVNDIHLWRTYPVRPSEKRFLLITRFLWELFSLYYANHFAEREVCADE